MAILDQIGNDSACQQGTKLVWSYYDGERQAITYKGNKSVISALYNSYKSVAGFSPDYDGIEYDPGRGLATLTLSRVADGEPLYELSANDVMNHISTNENFDSLTGDQVAAVLSAVDEREANSFTSLQSYLYEHLIRGIEEYPVSQYVLRETKNVSKRSVVTASFDNVNRVTSPPATNAANTLIGELPTGEWVKKAPIVRQIGARRWQIQTEWWWARKWSKMLYGGTYLE